VNTTASESTALPGEGDASRLRILKAAAEIAAECGYEGTTISKVTKRSGLPASSVYWFFRDKDDLIAEVLRHSFEQWISRQPLWQRPEQGDRPLTGVLRAILTRSVASLPEAPDFLRIGHMLLLETREVEPEARQYFLNVRADVTATIAAWFASYLDVELRVRRPELALDLARTVVAVTDGLFFAAQMYDGWSAEEAIDILVAIVEAALAEG